MFHAGDALRAVGFTLAEVRRRCNDEELELAVVEAMRSVREAKTRLREIRREAELEAFDAGSTVADP